MIESQPLVCEYGILYSIYWKSIEIDYKIWSPHLVKVLNFDHPIQVCCLLEVNKMGSPDLVALTNKRQSRQLKWGHPIQNGNRGDQNGVTPFSCIALQKRPRWPKWGCPIQLCCIGRWPRWLKGCHIVALPFTFKSVLGQNMDYGNSNISPHN